MLSRSLVTAGALPRGRVPLSPPYLSATGDRASRAVLRACSMPEMPRGASGTLQVALAHTQKREPEADGAIGQRPDGQHLDIEELPRFESPFSPLRVHLGEFLRVVRQIVPRSSRMLDGR